MLKLDQDPSAPRHAQFWNILEADLSLLFKKKHNQLNGWIPNRTIAKGDLIDVYRIERLISDGGMSSVHLGRSVVDGSLAAIKISNYMVDYEGPAGARFEREATFLRMMNSMYYPKYIGYGVFCGRRCIISEYIPGSDLNYAVREARQYDIIPTKNFIVKVFLKTLDALSELHGNNIVHRDVKPANILISESGRIYLCDLGIAKCFNERTETDVNYIVGTSGYISPEQWGEAVIDGRSDIYALGLVMLELYYGITLKHRVAKGIGVHPEFRLEMVDGITLPGRRPTLAQIIRKCLEREVASRYQSVQEVIRDLARMA